MLGPDSSYSCLLIHICWKVDREARMEPPIHTEYFPLWGSDDLDLHCGWGKGLDFLLHPVGDTGEHGGASGEDSVGVQILTDVNVALHDAVVCGLVDTGRFHSQEGGLEQGLGATETLVADGDDLTVGELVALLQGGAWSSGLHLLLEVKGNVAEFLLDVTNDFTLGCKVKERYLEICTNSNCKVEQFCLRSEELEVQDHGWKHVRCPIFFSFKFKLCLNFSFDHKFKILCEKKTTIGICLKEKQGIYILFLDSPVVVKEYPRSVRIFIR